MRWPVELSHAARALLRRPGFAAAAIALLGVALGVNVAVFSLVQAVLLRPLPYAEPDRLVALSSEGRDRTQQPFSIPDFVDLRDGNQTLSGLAAYGSWGANITGSGDAERVQGIWAANDLFGLLGAGPMLGRALLPEDEHPGAPRVVLLTHGLWKRRFASDPAVLGRDLLLNGERYTVVGVLGPDFLLPGRDSELAVPQSFEADPRRHNRGANFLRVVGRLRPDGSHARAAADLTAIAARLQAAHPDTNVGASSVAVVPLQESVVGAHRPLLLVLQAAVALVLLMVCANVACLILARAASRQEELAVRSALGATRGRLILQLGGESLLLGLLGGLAGILLAYWLVPVLLALGPADLPRSGQVRLDGAAVAFGFGLAVVAGLLSGIVPALQATGAVRPVGSLTGRTVASSRAHARRGLVLAEVALSLVMLAGAGLLLQSFVRLQRVDPGFRTERLLTMRLSLPRGVMRNASRSRPSTIGCSPACSRCPTWRRSGSPRWRPSRPGGRPSISRPRARPWSAAARPRSPSTARSMPATSRRSGTPSWPDARSPKGTTAGAPPSCSSTAPWPSASFPRATRWAARSASTTRACPRGRRRSSVSWGT